jgi:serine/threonine protein kinase
LLQVGAVVGHKYRIVRPLGRGGMGEVYEAVQEPLARKVALKTILPEFAERSAAFSRFRREAESSAALGHPNIVQVTDFQHLPGEPPLLVMELLEGVTLRSAIDAAGKMDPARACFIAMQILSGLEAAHRSGIVHRDIKPANVFLMSTLAVRDLAKVLDFGVAKLVEDAAGDDKLTAFGQVLGTLAYMAPEQAAGVGEIDARADLYAVGATLYHMLTGITPLGARVLGAPPPSAAQSAPWLDPQLSAIIDRALERDPNARWSSAEEMAAALAPFADSSARPSQPQLGYDPAMAARLSAPTAGGSTGMAYSNTYSSPSHGTAPYGPPSHLTATGPSPTAPTAYGYGPPPPQASPGYMHVMPIASGTPKWAIAIGVAVAVGVAVATLVPTVMALHATRPANMERQIEASFLQNAKLSPCRLPSRCDASVEDHDVTFPVCTGHASRPGGVALGDTVLIKAAGKARLAMITEVPSPSLYTAKWVTTSGDADVQRSDVLAQVCTRGVSPAPPRTGLDD